MITKLIFIAGDRYPHEDMHAPLRRVIAAFGPKRCVWGSNFPNALWSKGSSYADNLALFTQELGLSEDEQRAILGTTAMRLWFPEVSLDSIPNEAEVAPIAAAPDPHLTRAEVAQHDSRDSAWLIIDDGVYDVTTFSGSHPGGAAILLSMAGQDATAEFDAFHERDAVEKLLAGLRVGSLSAEDAEAGAGRTEADDRGARGSQAIVAEGDGQRQ